MFLLDFNPLCSSLLYLNQCSWWWCYSRCTVHGFLIPASGQLWQNLLWKKFAVTVNLTLVSFIHFLTPRSLPLISSTSSHLFLSPSWWLASFLSWLIILNVTCLPYSKTSPNPLSVILIYPCKISYLFCSTVDNFLMCQIFNFYLDYVVLNFFFHKKLFWDAQYNEILL